MQAIILASGYGKRMGDRVEKKPKALLEFDGRSLLQRHLDTLKSLGVSPVVVTTGYLGEQISVAVAGIDGVTTVANERYDLGSMLSLHQGMAHISENDGLLVINADVLCNARILKRLVEEPGGNQLLLDRSGQPGDNAVRVYVQQGKIVELKRRVASQMHWTMSGESMGFFRFTRKGVRLLRDIVTENVMRGEADQSHEAVIRDLALADFSFFGIVDITGLPWIEIKQPEDIDRANKDLLAKIDDHA